MGLGLGVTYWSTGEPPSSVAEERKLVLPRFSTLAIAGNIAFDKSCAQCHGVNALGKGAIAAECWTDTIGTFSMVMRRPPGR